MLANGRAIRSGLQKSGRNKRLKIVMLNLKYLQSDLASGLSDLTCIHCFTKEKVGKREREREGNQASKLTKVKQQRGSQKEQKQELTYNSLVPRLIGSSSYCNHIELFT